ncbi:hypothetical protein B0E54_01793 [Micromonospora sp. MH99]|nr:hypothetical protein [Micromonospora sp. MH99]
MRLRCGAFGVWGVRSPATSTPRGGAHRDPHRVVGEGSRRCPCPHPEPAPPSASPVELPQIWGGTPAARDSVHCRAGDAGGNVRPGVDVRAGWQRLCRCRCPSRLARAVVLTPSVLVATAVPVGNGCPGDDGCLVTTALLVTTAVPGDDGRAVTPPLGNPRTRRPCRSLDGPPSLRAPRTARRPGTDGVVGLSVPQILDSFRSLLTETVQDLHWRGVLMRVWSFACGLACRWRAGARGGVCLAGDCA